MNLSNTSQRLLLPYQQRWVNDKSQVKVIVKSRRIGISWAEAANAVVTAMDASGKDVWYISYNEEQTREFVKDCEWWAKHFNQVVEGISGQSLYKQDADKSTRVFGIEFSSGYRITALSSNPANLRGKQGVVIIDEAAFVPNLPELLKAAIALTIWGGSIHIISTYNGTAEPFYGLVQAVLSGNKEYSLHGPITFDDAIKEGLYERICQMGGQVWSGANERKWRDRIVGDYGDDAEEELFCVPRAPSMDYYPPLLVEACMNDLYSLVSYECDDAFNLKSDGFRVTETRQWLQQIIAPRLKALDGNIKSFIGFDFGRTADLSVICPILEMPSLTRICPFMVQMRNVPIRQQEQILDFVIEGLPNFCHGSFDAGGNGLVMSEFAQQRYGKSLIDQVYLQPKVYSELGPALKSAFEERSLIIPKHADVLADLGSVKITKGIPKVPERARYKGSDGKYRHGDTFIALALAYRSAKTKGVNSVKQFRRSTPALPTKPSFTQRTAILNDYGLGDTMISDSDIRGLFIN